MLDANGTTGLAPEQLAVLLACCDRRKFSWHHDALPLATAASQRRTAAAEHCVLSSEPPITALGVEIRCAGHPLVRQAAGGGPSFIGVGAYGAPALRFQNTSSATTLFLHSSLGTGWACLQKMLLQQWYADGTSGTRLNGQNLGTQACAQTRSRLTGSGQTLERNSERQVYRSLRTFCDQSGAWAGRGFCAAGVCCCAAPSLSCGTLLAAFRTSHRNSTLNRSPYL